METVSKIRRWVLADGLSIREVSRRTGISRNTVRKYLREDIVAPRYRQSGSRPSRKLLDYEVRLRALYEADLHPRGALRLLSCLPDLGGMHSLTVHPKLCRQVLVYCLMPHKQFQRRHLSLRSARLAIQRIEVRTKAA